MKVLVTGATGFLGSHIAEQLVAEGHEVRALVRKTSKTALLERLGADLRQASLETGADLDEAVTGVDAIVHGAAIVKAKSAEEFRRVNTGGTQNLVDATIRCAPDLKRFVYVSSLAAHGFGKGGLPRPHAESSAPVTHYGRSKLEGERVVLGAADRMPVTVFRPPAIYGPRDTEMLAFFKIVASRVVPFLGSPSNRASLVYAADCARAIVLSLTKEHPSGRVYSVEDGCVYTQREVVDHIEAALDRKVLAKFPVPISLVYAAAVGSELVGKLRGEAVMLTRDKVNELREQQVSEPSSSLRSELDWTPKTQFPEGARLSVDWYRSQGLL